MSQNSLPPPRILLVTAFAVVFFVWGSTYLAIRFAVETMPPFLMTGVRLTLAGLCLLAVSPRRELGRMSLVHVRSTLIPSALLFVGGQGILSWAEQDVPSGTASLILATIPLWIALLGAIPRGPLPSRITALGLGFGVVGVFILTPASFEHHGAGSWSLLLGAVSWAVGSLWIRRRPTPLPFRSATGLQLLVGGLLLLGTGSIFGEWSRVDLSSLTWASTGALLYLILFGSVLAYSAYGWLLRVADPVLVGTYAFVNPLVAVTLSHLVEGEIFSPLSAIGGATILISSGLVHFGARRDRKRHGRPTCPSVDERNPIRCSG